MIRVDEDYNAILSLDEEQLVCLISAMKSWASRKDKEAMQTLDYLKTAHEAVLQAQDPAAEVDIDEDAETETDDDDLFDVYGDEEDEDD